ncbi:putative reverse transcriptase domain-containing protein [Tanacetum coccineum]
MAPKRTTRSTPATTTTPTTSVTDEQLKRLIDQGVADALAARDAERSRNGEDSHDSGTGVRRQAPPARECTYPDFMKCKPLYFKGTEGVIKVKGTDVVGYNQRFQELALLCDRMFPEESDKIEKYVGGLPDMIHESVIASMLKTMQDAIEFATELMDKKIRTFAERQRSGKKKPYGGSKPLCSKCNYYLDGQCALKCHKCDRVGHLARDYRTQGHFKRDCPKLRNNNHGNQGGNGNAPAKVYAVGRAGTNPDSNVVTDLMPVELGSLDVIIDMDWLAKYQVVIVCAKKIIRIPWRNETLIFCGDGSDRGNETRLNIISCTKRQKYMLKGCPIFLAHVTTKETEDKSEKKQLEDIPIVRNFPKVFPKDLSGLPPTQQVEFKIDLIPSTAPISTSSISY